MRSIGILLHVDAQFGQARFRYRMGSISLRKGSVTTFDLFTAEAKQPGFSIIKYVLWLRCKAKIIGSPSVYLTNL